MSTTYIQIVGLPRSGTAFASVLLMLHPDCIGFHELASTDENWDKTLLDAGDRYRYVVDSTTYGHFARQSVPFSRRIVLTRNHKESADDCTAHFKHDVEEGTMGTLLAILNQWAEDNADLTLDHYQLFTLEGMKALWEAAFKGDMPFPADKAKLLALQNIQRHRPDEVFGLENGKLLIKRIT